MTQVTAGPMWSAAVGEFGYAARDTQTTFTCIHYFHSKWLYSNIYSVYIGFNRMCSSWETSTWSWRYYHLALVGELWEKQVIRADLFRMCSAFIHDLPHVQRGPTSKCCSKKVLPVVQYIPFRQTHLYAVIWTVWLENKLVWWNVFGSLTGDMMTGRTYFIS